MRETGRGAAMRRHLRSRFSRWLGVIVLLCSSPLPAASSPAPAAPAVDWALTFDPGSTAGTLAPSLLGQYDLSGALFHYDRVPRLPSMMKAAGFAEWRVGLGRWEFATLLLPRLTDGSSCPLQQYPAAALAPPGTTDLDLIGARDWFTYTDGTPVTLAMTADDSRYRLGYVRSVLDVAAVFGAEPYLDIDHMPRALAANQTPSRTNADWVGACGTTWTNRVSNVRPADPAVFAAAVVGLVKRIVEGSGGEPGRPVRTWEIWNEPELAYAWNPSVGDFGTYLQTAVTTLQTLDAYRRQTANPDGKAIRIGLGSFADASTAAKLLPPLDAAGVPFDFVSFHAYDDDPLVIVAKIEDVAAARRASANHQDVELALSEWGPALDRTTLDPQTMDLALHHATVIALGAAAGLTHAHHSIFWEFYDGAPASLAFIHHDGSPKPAYYAYQLLAQVIGARSSRLAPLGNADGRLDGGMGAVLASRDGAGKVRVLLVNRGAQARTATVGATPTAVTVFDDPARPPHAVAPSAVLTVPPRSLVLVERPGPAPSPAQIVFEAPGIPGGGNVQELFTMNLDGSNLTQITHDGLNKFLPHFSPDGTRLVYTKFLVGAYGTPNAQTDVVVYDFASAKEIRLTSTGRGFQAAWSPDGRRIAYGSIYGDSLSIMNADGSGSHLVGGPSGALDDQKWYDFAWSSDDWVLFAVAQDTNNCFKVRLDKIRPDGTARTQVTDGGPNCTPSGMEQSGDADPGFSADGKTIYSSRGFPRAPAGLPGRTERRLYSFSSDAWTPGKVETDLSLPAAPDCVEGVPKGSPDGTRVLLFRACAGEPHAGVTLTDTAGSYRTWIADGFGADWNPVANAGTAPCLASPTTLCLNNGRFAVTAHFDAGGGNSGTAQVVQLTADTGYLWFFSSSNVEAAVKVLDGCALDGHYWVFAGGLTDVDVVITVTDTRTGIKKIYENPPSTKFQPIQDTSAFATCP